MSVTLLLLGASVAIMAASATKIQVTAARELMIAVVDSGKTSPARGQLRASLISTFETAFAATCGDDVHIKAVSVGARDAKLKLNSQGYDAALVIGADRPYALRRLELVTLAGAVSTGPEVQPICLILANGDPSLNAKLRSAFVRMLAHTPIATQATAPIAQIQSTGGSGLAFNSP